MALLDRTARYKLLTVTLTFFCYMTYHMSRKAISVVKNAWLPTDCYWPDKNVTEFCGDERPTEECKPWAPFNGEGKLGDLDFTFLIGYAFAMFVSGHFGDRFNLRYFLCIGMLLSGLFTALLGLAYFFKIHSFAFFIVIQFLGGVVQSTGWPSVVAVMANWFGASNRGFIMGLWNSHTSLGNIVGAIIPGIWVHGVWAWSFIVPGVIIAGMGVIILLFLVVDPADVGCPSPDHVDPVRKRLLSDSRSVNEGEETDRLLAFGGSGARVRESELGLGVVSPTLNKPTAAIGFTAALRIPGVLEYSFCLFFSKFMNYIFLYWMPKYVNHVCIHGHSLSSQHSAYYSSLFDVGGILGGVILGIVSDRTGASATPSAVMLLLGIPSLYMFNVYADDSLASLLGFMALTGALLNGPYSLITTAVAADLGTHEVLSESQKAKATVAAIIDGTGSIGAALGPYIVGIALEDVKNPWTTVMYICMGASLLSMLFLVRICKKELLALRAYLRSRQ